MIMLFRDSLPGFCAPDRDYPLFACFVPPGLLVLPLALSIGNGSLPRFVIGVTDSLQYLTNTLLQTPPAFSNSRAIRGV